MLALTSLAAPGAPPIWFRWRALVLRALVSAPDGAVVLASVEGTAGAASDARDAFRLARDLAAGAFARTACTAAMLDADGGGQA